MYVREIIVDASPGSTLEETIIESISLVYNYKCDVVIVHNGKHYRLNRKDVAKLFNIEPDVK